MNGINISNKAISIQAAHVISIPKISKEENDNPVANTAFQGSLGRYRVTAIRTRKQGSPPTLQQSGAVQNAKDIRCGTQQCLMILEMQTGDNILSSVGKCTHLPEKIINCS